MPTAAAQDALVTVAAASQKTSQLTPQQQAKSSGAQGPMQISGVLSVKNLKEAVFEANAEAGGPLQMAGDLEYYGGMG